MALYISHREQIFWYYWELIKFSRDNRKKEENSHIKSALNLNIILSLACYVEGYMEKISKCLLGYYRLVYNEINKKEPDVELKRPINGYYHRIEADIYQKISQSTGVDNYDKIFKLLLGKSFKREKSFQSIVEPIQVLFQLRNVIAHAKEVSAYEVSAYWNNHILEEYFEGGYKRAENYLIKNGVIEERFVKAQSVEHFFSDAVADHFYDAVQKFIHQLDIFVEENLEKGEILRSKLNKYNREHSERLSFMEFCEMNAHATPDVHSSKTKSST